jgi:hypothetical protein
MEFHHSATERLQIVMAASMKMTALWDIAPYILVEVDKTFQRCILPPSSGLRLIMMIKAISTFKTSVSLRVYKITQSNISEGCLIFIMSLFVLYLFVVYVTVLSISQTVQHKMIE